MLSSLATDSSTNGERYQPDYCDDPPATTTSATTKTTTKPKVYKGIAPRNVQIKNLRISINKITHHHRQKLQQAGKPHSVIFHMVLTVITSITISKINIRHDDAV